MRFCTKCDNMFYLKLNDEDNQNHLVYYCRNCGNEDVIDQNATTVMKSNINGNNDNFVNVINKYTKHDNTIPRVDDIECTNSSCISHEEKDKCDVLLIRHDEVNMKYMYLCAACDNVWKSSIK